MARKQAEPNLLDVALKEWALVCDWLLAGRLCLLVRKGGVYEDEGPGRFRLEHPRFLLYPTDEHERLDWVKPAWLAGEPAEPLDRPGVVTFRGYAETVRAWRAPSRAAVERLGDLLPWAGPYLDMRFSYKPERPVYVVLVRAMRLAAPKQIERKPAYEGCRSWVALDEADAVSIGVGGASPVLDRAAIDEVERRVDAVMTD